MLGSAQQEGMGKGRGGPTWWMFVGGEGPRRTRSAPLAQPSTKGGWGWSEHGMRTDPLLRRRAVVGPPIRRPGTAERPLPPHRIRIASLADHTQPRRAQCIRRCHNHGPIKTLRCCQLHSLPPSIFAKIHFSS